MREVNLLYYTVGASKKGLIPDLLPDYFDDVANAARASLPELGVPQHEAFRELLDALVLPSDIVTRLSPESIVTVRTKYEPEVQRFRTRWWTTLQRGQHGLADQAGGQPIHEVLKEVVAKEAKGLRRYARVGRGISVGSLVVSLANLVPEPTLAALSFAVSLMVAAAASESVRHRIIGSHLHVLGTRLHRMVEDASCIERVAR
jgi:hypothetical protein